MWKCKHLLFTREQLNYPIQIAKLSCFTQVPNDPTQRAEVINAQFMSRKNVMFRVNILPKISDLEKMFGLVGNFVEYEN
jgi:hypothetical protein